MSAYATSAGGDLRRRRQLVTPEGVSLDIGVASAGARVAAFMMDATIIVGSLIGMTLALLLLFWATGSRPGTGDIIATLWLIGLFVLRNAYFLFFELGPRAATPGKRRAKIRVAARDGGRMTADAIIARNLLREVELFLPLGFLAQAAASGGGGGWVAIAGLGWTGLLLLFPLLNRDRLRAGDLIAGTWVIRDPRRLLGRVLGDTREAPAFVFDDEDVEAYGVHELQTLEDVLRRGDAKALHSVAHAIAGRLGWQLADEDIPAFLGAYYAALRARLERHLLLGRRRRDKHDV